MRFPLVAVFCGFAFLLSPANGLAAKKPNVVFFLVDDLGYMDIGAYNPKTFYETPNVDRLAKEGMLFRHCYVTNSLRRSTMLDGSRHITGTDEPAMNGIFIRLAVSYICLASFQL